jgi:hypothetical protein
MVEENFLVYVRRHITTLNPSLVPFLEDYLDVIDCPDKYEGIIEASRQFNRIYPYISEILSKVNVSNQPKSDVLKKCFEISKLISLIDVQQDNVPKEIIINTRIKIPLLGIYEIYPLYICIVNGDISNNYSRRLLILQSYLLIANYDLRCRNNKPSSTTYNLKNSSRLNEYKSSLVTSLRLARQLGDLRKNDTLLNLPEKACPSHEYLQHIIDCGELFDPIRIVLIYCLNKTVSRRAQHGSSFRRNDFVKTIHSLNDAVDPDLEGKVDSISFFRDQTQRASDIDPDETRDGAEFFDIQGYSEYRPSMSGGQNKQSKKHYLSKIALHNQRLPNRWEMLTGYEVSLYLTAIQELAEERSPYDLKLHKDSIMPQKELAAAALTLFLRSSAKIGSNTLYSEGNKNSRYSNIMGFGYRYYKSKIGCWIVTPAKIDFRQHFNNRIFEQSEKNREYLFVSSGTGLERILDDYIESARELRKKPNAFSRVDESFYLRLFYKKTTVYQENIKALISNINERFKTRITLKRLELYIFDAILHHPGSDITVAMLLTGKMDFLGIPQLHYTAFSAKTLQQIYKDVCSDIFKRHSCEKTARFEKETRYDNSVSSFNSIWGGTLGTPFRPRKKTVKNLVSGLKKRMHDIANSDRNLRKLLLIHNNMARYTAIMFAFSTGFRAVKSPILPPSQIDMDTGIGVISDKDGLDNYNARIVWLPPVCLLQYKLYFEHLDLLLPKLEFIDLNAFNKLKNLLTHSHPDDRLPLFFLLDKTGIATQIIPTDIWKNIRANLQYNLPSNASRHYLRSTLLERGCPTEVIAAFMGHWERGEEPWGRYSALSPDQYVNILAGYLEKILHEDGWVSLPGLQEYW